MPVRIGARRSRRPHDVWPGFLACVVCVVVPLTALCQSKNLAPGFSNLPRGAKIIVMPPDIELFSISAGGVLEPKADWTEAAQRNFRSALLEQERKLELAPIEVTISEADEFSEVNYLHAAVARAIALHHFGPSTLQLPTKNGKLDWSMGDSVAPIRAKTGADYALFSWMRDTYTSGERALAMIAMALVGVGLGGGSQVGYASLVDLSTGQIVWFNRLSRRSGDLREGPKARETVEALVEGFPVPK